MATMKTYSYEVQRYSKKAGEFQTKIVTIKNIKPISREQIEKKVENIDGINYYVYKYKLTYSDGSEKQRTVKREKKDRKK